MRAHCVCNSICSPLYSFYSDFVSPTEMSFSHLTMWKWRFFYLTSAERIRFDFSSCRQQLGKYCCYWFFLFWFMMYLFVSTIDFSAYLVGCNRNRSHINKTDGKLMNDWSMTIVTCSLVLCPFCSSYHLGASFFMAFIAINRVMLYL